MTTTVISVPATTANLGAGFDVFGLALSLRAQLGAGAAPPGAQVVDRRHPADVAYRAAGGSGQIWVESSLPMGRGLGFSGAMRVGGVALAVAEQAGDDAGLVCSGFDDDQLKRVFEVAAELEGHGDNVGASVYGGLVAVLGDRVVSVPSGWGDDPPVVVVWVPDGVTTGTKRSRAALPTRIDRSDAVHNLGSVAAFVTAWTTGRIDLLARGVDDRLHTEVRLSASPTSAAAVAAGREAQADAVWLSGSGPSVAMLCRRERVHDVADSLPDDGHVKLLEIETSGVLARSPHVHSIDVTPTDVTPTDVTPADVTPTDVTG